MNGAIQAAPLWAITAYFNPSRYQRRLVNYREFRSRLNIPLVTAELSSDGHYELSAADADILIQVASPAVLWHKEALLNVALKAVPQSVPYAAWLDCDVFFQGSRWQDDALEQLRTQSIVQLYTELRHLAEDESLRPDESVAAALRRPPTAHGIAFLKNCAPVGPKSFAVENTPGMRMKSFGMAWAASTTLLRRHGFYDAMIMGSGDRAMACAALGRFRAVVSALHLSEARATHFLQWARPFFADVQGRVGYVSGSIFHLWHGSLEDRYYNTRHQAFSRLDFLPQRDLDRDSAGVLKWRNGEPEFTEFFRQYFAARREDGYGEQVHPAGTR